VINRRLNSKDYFNYITKIEDSKKLFKKVLITGLVLLALGAATLSKTSYSRLAKQWNREYILNRFGVVIYQVNDLVNTLKPTISSWFGYDVSYKKFVDYYENNSLEVSDNEYTNMFKDYNVVFVHMESMTSFLIDLEINGISIAPNLTKLSQEGMYFSNFYPQIGVGTSSDSEFTLSTSLMPASNGTAFVSYFDREYSTIQKLMKDEGYYTFSMHGNKASMWNRSNMHPSLGYMDFYSKTSFVIDEEVGLGLSDKSFFRQAIPILENIEENNEKYMGTIITLSNHTPFDNNELFEQIDLTYHTTQYNEDTKEDEEVVYDYLEGTKLGDYIRSSHYADDALGEFISYIQESDYFDNTLFVFYGDHDPKLALSEFYNYYNFDPETGEILDESSENYVAYDYYSNELNKKTPLILWTKNKKLSQEVSYYMGMIDVSPTIGNMVGIYNEYALGHDIFEIKNDNIIAFPNGNFLTSKVYYRDSKEEYKPLNLDEALSDSYIKECKVYVDNIIDISNGIIVHDLIKASKNKESTKELK
jgi:phosphoglycerol transferase MdoB-like AlkP superfamily enzyme